MRSDHGFSLIEVLVSLFIISTISIAGTTVLLSSFQSRDALAASTEQTQAYAQAHTRIREDLLQWVPRAAESRPGLDPSASFLGGGIGEAGLLFAFVRDGWTNPGLTEERSGLFAVRYVFESGRLIRRTRPFADPLFNDDFRDEVLLDGLDDVYAEFNQGQLWTREWRATPETPITAPPAVRLVVRPSDKPEMVWMFLLPALGAI